MELELLDKPASLHAQNFDILYFISKPSIR